MTTKPLVRLVDDDDDFRASQRLFLGMAGFDVEEIDYVRSLSPEAVKLYGLRSEIVYVVRKPSGRAGRE